MKKFATLISISLLLLSANVVSGQTVIGTTGTVKFTASADHNTVVNGNPILDHYDLQMTLQSSTSTIVFTQGLAKPTPDATNTITAPLSASLIGAMGNNKVYVAFVNSVGTGGSTQSAASNPFVKVTAPAAAGAPLITSP